MEEKERGPSGETTEQEQLAFLARAGDLLSHSLDMETTLRRLANLAVPQIADWCAVDLVQEDGSLERVAVSHVDPAQVQLAYDLVERYPPAADAAGGTHAVVSSGQAELHRQITDGQLVAAARDEEHLSLLRRLQLDSMIIVPLVAPLPEGEQVLGTLTLATAESGRCLEETDLTLAQELARRAAWALDNARLYGEARRLNEQLEQHVAARTRALRHANEQLKVQIAEAQQAESRFRRLLEAAPDPIVIVDEQGKIVLVNAQAEVVFGYRRDEMLGAPVESLIPAAHRRAHRSHRAGYMETPHLRRMGVGLELEALAADGRPFPVEVSLSPLDTEEGKRVIAVVRDISLRRQTEQQAQQNEALYRLIARHIPNGSVLVVDKDLRYRLADGPSLRELGLDSLEGKTPWELLPEDLAAERVAAYRQALAGTPTASQMTLDGRTYRQQTVPLPGNDGEIEAALVLTQDITDLKSAEDTAQRLLQLSAKLHGTLEIEALLDTLTEEAIQLTGATGGFSGLNGPQGLMTRHYIQDGRRYPVQKTWQMGEGIPGQVMATRRPYLTNDTLADKQVSAFADRFGVRSLVCTPVLNRQGHLLAFFEVTNKADGAPFTAEDREKLVAVSHIAAIGIENAQAYTQLRHLSQQIVSAQETERRRLSRDLHDSAGQLLTALKLNLSMLAQAQGDESLQAQIEEAVQMADEAHEEIRAASQRLRPPTLELVGLDKTLRTLCGDFGRQAGLPISYQGSSLPSLPDEVEISFYRFLQEALANVARHAQAKSVAVRLAHEDGEISLSVSDDGVGMLLTHRLHRPGNGSGVGLLGLRERFELIGGRVEIASTPGEGTRLTSVYPLPAAVEGENRDG